MIQTKNQITIIAIKVAIIVNFVNMIIATMIVKVIIFYIITNVLEIITNDA